tara:strand:+ start:1555 stop:2808 length:1254 start_codon:yes stop_codon:yes gene_type:complete
MDVNRQTLILTIIFGCSFILLTYSTSQINLTYDSREYLQAAESFQSEGKLLTTSGESFTNWAPLFPLILSTFGGDLEVYRYFNLLCYLSLCWGMMLLIRHFIQNKRMQIMCAIWLALATPILMQFNFLWSEPLFITFLVFKILLLLQFQMTSRLIYLYGLAALGILICLQRYAGLFLIPAFALALFDFNKPNRTSLLRGLFYGLISVLPTIIWIGLHYQQKGTGFSAFASNLFVSFLPNLFRSYYQDIFFSWFLPNQLVFQLGQYYLLALLILLIIVWIRTKIRLTKGQFFLLIISITYYLFLLLIDYTVVNDKVKDFSFLSDMERYLAVIYVPILLLLFSLIDQNIGQLEGFYIRVLFAVLIIWSLYPITRAIKNSIHWNVYPPLVKVDPVSVAFPPTGQQHTPGCSTCSAWSVEL